MKSSLKAKKSCFILKFSLPFFSPPCHVHVGVCLPFNSPVPLWWTGSGFFSPFRGRAVISCFNLSLSFFHPINVSWYPHGTPSSPLKMDDFVPPSMEVSHKPSFPLLLTCTFWTRTGFVPAGTTSTASWAQAGFICDVWWSLLHNTSKLLSFQSTQCVWCKSQLVFPACGSVEEPCSSTPWWQPQQKGKSRVYNDAPLIFPCNLETQGDDWLKWGTKMLLGSVGSSALHTQPEVPVSRCYSLKCVNQRGLHQKRNVL